MIAIIGTSDRPCWLAEACNILLLLLCKQTREHAAQEVKTLALHCLKPVKDDCKTRDVTCDETDLQSLDGVQWHAQHIHRHILAQYMSKKRLLNLQKRNTDIVLFMALNMTVPLVGTN